MIELFYIFSGLALVSALLVITSRNPIHSVLFLILVFCNVSALILMLGAEFMAMIFLIVYVGAIAVLFLFVVMMLNVKISEYRDNYVYYVPIGGFISLIFLFEIFMILDLQNNQINAINVLTLSSYEKLQLDYMTNIEVLGEILYTDYFYCFIISGMILLVSMIGAIVLTLYKKKHVKRQEIAQQVYAQMDGIRLVTPIQK